MKSKGRINKYSSRSGHKEVNLSSSGLVSIPMEDNLNAGEKELLKKEISEQIARETLKKDILKELNPPSFKFHEFIKHPTLLVILGFILTTAAGGWLTANWQGKEWNRQQQHLTQQRKLDQKYAIMDEVTKVIGQTVTAADDVLALVYWDAPEKKYTQEESKRKEYWQQSSQAWRINVNSIRPKLAAYFKNEQIIGIFDQIVTRRGQIGNDITNLLADLDELGAKSLQDATIKKNANEMLKSVNEVRDYLKQLTEMIVKEIQDSEKPSPLSDLLSGNQTGII